MAGIAMARRAIDLMDYQAHDGIRYQRISTRHPGWIALYPGRQDSISSTPGTSPSALVGRPTASGQLAAGPAMFGLFFAMIACFEERCESYWPHQHVEAKTW